MMDPTTLVIVAACIFLFGLVSHTIENTPLTAPMLFVTIGLVAGPFGLNLIELSDSIEDIIIEVTLVLVLFSDASRIRIRELRASYFIPARLLAIGCLLYTSPSPRDS